MPLYEYQCVKCGRFEIIQKFSDEPLAACPTCGQEVHKLLSAPAIQFKGSGWYITDYARKGGAGAAPSGGDGGASKSSESTSSPQSSTSKDSSASGSSSSK